MFEYECPHCGSLRRSPNGTGSDMACCGEVGDAGLVEHQHRLTLWKRAENCLDGIVRRIWTCKCGKVLTEPTSYPL
jgi:hypothetical protein